MPALTRRAALAALALSVPGLAVRADEKDKPAVEFRRAETAPAPGLTEATVAGTKAKVYLHKGADLTAADVATVEVTGDGDALALEITFTAEGAKKAARLSEGHADKPVAIVVGGKVVAAPVVRARLGSAVRVSGSFTRDDVRPLVEAVRGKR